MLAPPSGGGGAAAPACARRLLRLRAHAVAALSRGGVRRDGAGWGVLLSWRSRFGGWAAFLLRLGEMLLRLRRSRRRAALGGGLRSGGLRPCLRQLSSALSPEGGSAAGRRPWPRPLFASAAYVQGAASSRLTGRRLVGDLAARSGARRVLCRANAGFWPISLRFTLTGRPSSAPAAQEAGVPPGHSRLATPVSLDGCVKRGEIGQKFRGWRRIAAMRRSVRQPVASACRRWVRRPPARRSCLARPAGWRLRSGSVALAGGGASCLRPESRWPLHRGRLGGQLVAVASPGGPFRVRPAGGWAHRAEMPPLVAWVAISFRRPEAGWRPDGAEPAGLPRQNQGPRPEAETSCSWPPGVTCPPPRGRLLRSAARMAPGA